MSVNYDDWCTDVVCKDCWTVPCQCSSVTRILQRLASRLNKIVRARHERRKLELHRHAHPELP